MKAILFLILFCAVFAFAQGGAIKFQIPLDSAGRPVAPVQVPKQEPQKLGVTANMPLNLAELSARDTASFETYSKRLALVRDSISAMQKEIGSVRKRTLSLMPALEPKGEFEKQAEFDVRKAKWEKELDENTKRDSKSLTDRLAELERAGKKIEDNQASLYSSIEIKTSPEAASIWLNKEEIGASPAKYELALPGYTVIKIQKENYEPWDTTFTLQPMQKIKISVTLQEKNIFSKEGELDFPKILAKDTTAEGYRERIKKVEARSSQIDGEIKVILEDFSNQYPALEPQKPDETLQDFERRKTAWTSEGIRQYGALMKKHEAYKNKLKRTIEVLEDNIVAVESQLIAETPLNANITLGAYDVEREAFEVTVEDTANAKTLFHFVGKVGVPRDTAKMMNRSTDGFLASISYINYPFVSGDSSFNLAMKELLLSRKTVPLKVDGKFKPIGRFEAMAGYGAWRTHADSLLGGQLKERSLGLDYALKGEQAKDETGSSGGIGWRGWTTGILALAAGGCAYFAWKYYRDAKDSKDDFDRMKAAGRDREALSKQKDDYDKKKDYKNYFGIAAGVLAGAGIFTLTF